MTPFLFYFGPAMTALSRIDTDDQLITLGRQYLSLKEKLLQAAKTDPSQVPTPTNISKALGVSVDDALVIMDFADHDLGAYEADAIRSAVESFIDPAGRTIDPLLSEHTF